MEFRGDWDALILGVLQEDSLHGYEISRRINNRAQGEALRVKESQLYPILHRLEAEGQIAADWVPQEGKPARKVYYLTDEGRRILAKKQHNWAQFMASVNAVLFPAREVRNG